MKLDAGMGWRDREPPRPTGHPVGAMGCERRRLGMKALMRFRMLSVAQAVVALAACGSGYQAARSDPSPPSAPTSVSCADAPQLRQRALDDRRQSTERSSDHEKIYIGNRASYFAALAIVADLKCRVTMAEADEALKPAFEAARRAEDTRSMYERAQKWAEADFIATQVIARLIQQLPSATAR